MALILFHFSSGMANVIIVHTVSVVQSIHCLQYLSFAVFVVPLSL